MLVCLRVSTLRRAIPISSIRADIVLWDSHPLALGATPQQVWIDGIPQLTDPHAYTKPQSFQDLPKVPNFDQEAKEALEYDGLPPLEPKSSSKETVVFANVSSLLLRTGPVSADGDGGSTQIASVNDSSVEPLWVVVRSGQLVCADTVSSVCVRSALRLGRSDLEIVDLGGGAISPALTTFGSPLGLEEISGEASTKDGSAPDGLVVSAPSIAGGTGALVRAVDGLQFGTRHAL